MRNTVSLITVGLLFAGITLAAQRSFVPPPSTLTFSNRWVPPGDTGLTQIMGSVIDIRQVPVTKVKVRLRNLESGSVTGETETDENGDYVFDVEVPSSYVVEMVLVDGYVIALSNAGSIARFETLQTVIQLPGRWDSARQAMLPMQTTLGFLGMSSETTMTAATLTIASNQDISPVDSGEPVSPR